MSSGDGAPRSAAWSGAYLVISRVSALVSVPILLDALGTDLYAVWVLASALVFAQGLVDLGFSAALVRFVAVGATEGSVRAVRTVIRRVALVYVCLSLLGVTLWIFAASIARALPYLEDGQIDEAVVLLHYTAVAFALTNATTLISAALQGLDRVASAYRAQALGTAAFVPLLIAALAAVSGVDAVGIATVGCYGLQLLLLAPSLWGTLRRLPRNTAKAPTVRAMFAMGMKWQVSSWADFATFQLPRIAAGISLSSGAVVLIDLALRVGQAVATPLFALLPIVLPRASAAWAANGREGVAAFLRPLIRLGAPLCLLGAAVAVPISAPAIATWTGQALTLGDAIAASVVVAGVLAHASTGAMSSILLAIGEIGAVVRYKSLQLALAVPLVAIGALLGSFTLAAGLGLALLVPAVWFNATASVAIGVPFVLPRRLCVAAAGVLAVNIAAVAILTPLTTAAVVLAVTGAGALIVAAAVLRGVDPVLIRALLDLRPRRVSPIG